MFNMTFGKPGREFIENFISSQADNTFSYREVGHSIDAKAPKGYVPIHYRVKLGEGEEAFSKAKQAIRDWEMFHLGWVELCWPDAPIEKNTLVVVIASALGVWSFNACRIVYLIENHGEIDKYGFAYGTLPTHVEKGEERFMVEWDKRDNCVHYDLFSFSVPNTLLAKLGNFAVKKFQHCFARHSLRAMFMAVNCGDTEKWKIAGVNSMQKLI